MVEIPIWFLITLLFTAFGTGAGIGYKISTPNISQDKSHCNTFASFPENTKWSRSLEIGRTYRNGKCVSVSCPVFTQESSECLFLKGKCKLIS